MTDELIELFCQMREGWLPEIGTVYTITLDHAQREAVLAALRWRPEVRDGWKLVPIEPTSDMIDAGGNTPKMQVLDGYCSDAQLRGCFTEDRLAGPKSDCAIAQCWKAMLAASPQSQDA